MAHAFWQYLCVCPTRSVTTEQQYDYEKSTEDNYGVVQFGGLYADIRPLLDYTWHRAYSCERIEVQDRIIERLCEGSVKRQSSMLPWVVFTAGAMGAGKGYVIRWMKDKGYFPMEHFVFVDPDAIRQELPEWPEYVRRDPDKAGDRTQKEAGCIAEILGYCALRRRLNVVFDGSLRNSEWYKGYFKKLRWQFPGIRIMILHVVAPIEQVLLRAASRAALTGRVVPEKLLRESAEDVPTAVKELAPHAHFVFRVVNSPGRDPEVAREEGAPFPPESVDITWDLIKKLWMDPDLNGDGELDPEEINVGISLGILTEDVVKTMDLDGDGKITAFEVNRAQSCARRNASLEYR